MRILGVDYGINCPAIAYREDLDTNLHWYVNYRKDGLSYPSLPNGKVIWNHSVEKDNIARAIELANWALSIVNTTKPDFVYLEDYAFSANGNITALAENAGLFKIEMHRQFNHIPLVLVAPTKMKKFATGKGNAKKEQIVTAFLEKFPQYAEWPKICHPKAKSVGSPIADIADAYFLAAYHDRIPQ